MVLTTTEWMFIDIKIKIKSNMVLFQKQLFLNKKHTYNLSITIDLLLYLNLNVCYECYDNALLILEKYNRNNRKILNQGDNKKKYEIN